MRGESVDSSDSWTPTATLSYMNPQGEAVVVTMALTESGLADVLTAMENGQADE